MSSGHHVRAVFSSGAFRKLLASRIVGQIADGVFQASLAGSILFNPDRNTTALAIALGFAVLLLPYSLLGPFTGVMLDVWPRRRVLIVSHILSAVLHPFVALTLWWGLDSWALLPLALLAIGVQRFAKSGTLAALPHVTKDEELITGNSISTTLSGVSFTVGIGLALGMSFFLPQGDAGYAALALFSVVGYLIAAWYVSWFSPTALGPDHTEQHQNAPRSVLDGVRVVAADMMAGAKHLRQRPLAGWTMVSVVLARACYGVMMLGILLLFRNTFVSSGFLQAGEVGMAQTMVAAAGGSLLAAALTPGASRMMTPRRWVAVLLGFVAVTDAVFVSMYTIPAIMVAAVATTLAAQGVKLVTETLIQHECLDEFRGRAFTLFDTLYNVCMVAGLIVGALVLPESGVSYAVIAGLALTYAGLSAGYLYATRRGSVSREGVKHNEILPVQRDVSVKEVVSTPR